ncbi:shikimate dehydrogenase [Rathayibacter sp. AY1E1]|uniref:shikimate dehydrogenase family protein n=1 Tax=Rathayibacter sp. AY1E1 TaxID=2080549 RepID=UPI000CE84CDF|nr:shikimate dehydrogenase [Rathayibacter sp. AY1E1]PPH55761.1 hypothetical protein C5C67_02580 [Rathayibacter sp. AY1E1]
MTLQYQLVGHPIEHSRSPAIQNAAFVDAGIDAIYSLRPTLPEEFDATMSRLLNSEIAGANITAPFKERILAHVEPADELVAHLGASNCVARVDGLWRAFNTDTAGFALAAQSVLRDAVPAEVAVVVLGSGGAARAVVGASAMKGWAVTVVSRSLAKAERLRAVATTVGVEICGAVCLDQVNEDPTLSLLSHGRPVVLFVNATPLGLRGERVPKPFSYLDTDVRVMDLLWVSTPLVQEHLARGGRAINGLAMVVEQAAEAWSIWTGRPAPRDVMLQAAVTEDVTN